MVDHSSWLGHGGTAIATVWSFVERSLFARTPWHVFLKTLAAATAYSPTYPMHDNVSVTAFGLERSGSCVAFGLTRFAVDYRVTQAAAMVPYLANTSAEEQCPKSLRYW